MEIGALEKKKQQQEAYFEGTDNKVFVLKGKKQI